MTGYEVLARLPKDSRHIPPIVIVSGMHLGPADRERLSTAAAIVPKSEISKGRLRDVMASLAQEGTGAQP
jgi:hypothetical protein